MLHLDLNPKRSSHIQIIIQVLKIIIMESLKCCTIFAIEGITKLIHWTEYLIFLPFTPILEAIFKRVLSSCDIQINGKRGWDIQVVNRKMYARIVAFGLNGAIESFTEGWWECEDIETLSAKGVFLKTMNIQNLIQPHKRLLYFLRWNWLNLQTKERAKLSCEPSYNLGSEFFGAFLDSSLLFSVAYFACGAKSLAEAQRHKMELTAEKLQLKPGMRVLDLGCGFGGLSQFLALEHGVTVVGITNSTAMAKEASQACSSPELKSQLLKNKGQIEIKAIDYRDLEEEGGFDRVLCIEIMFHMGKHNLDEFFKKIHSWLKPGGLVVIQDFTRVPGFPASSDFLNKYFFPGAYIFRLDEIFKSSEKYLELQSYLDMREDCIQTGREMFKAFDDNWVQRISKISIQYDQKFWKVMKIFFLSGAGHSRIGKFRASQFVFKKLEIDVN